MQFAISMAAARFPMVLTRMSSCFIACPTTMREAVGRWEERKGSCGDNFLPVNPSCFSLSMSIHLLDRLSPFSAERAGSEQCHDSLASDKVKVWRVAAPLVRTGEREPRSACDVKSQTRWGGRIQYCTLVMESSAPNIIFSVTRESKCLKMPPQAD